MRTETLAIVFTDIKGYTAATSSQTHVQNADMLKSMAKLIEPVVRSFDGRIVKSIGDAYMIVFRSPTEAVRCALAVQDRLHAHNQGKSEDRTLHIRVAVNIGEVRVHRGDVFGEPVNIAARVESVTPADEVYVSEAIYLTMNRTELPIERVGEFELKGIPEPVTVYHVRRFVDAPDDAEARKLALPFGGKQIALYQRQQWLRRATIALWLFALLGLSFAAYLRYRPETDYSEYVAATKAALEQENPTEAIAKAGQIPQSAVQERMLVRRYRRQAAQLLFSRGEVDAAQAEVDSLLQEDQRDGEALVLRGLLLAKRDELKTALQSINEGLKLTPSLAQKAEVVAAVTRGYSDPTTRKLADAIVETHIKETAVPALTRLLQTTGDRTVRQTAALRLERLGQAQEVDWVLMALEDLKSTNCKTKKNAIAKLVEQGDERAVGPLLKAAETKSCVSQLAAKAADTIMGK